MRGITLTAVEAAHVLFPESMDPADPGARFRTGEEVRAMLALHFGYDPGLHADTPPVGDVEVLLCALDVGSLEELRDLVEAGRRVQARARTPLIVV